jgi:hypothetical protein
VPSPRTRRKGRGEKKEGEEDEEEEEEEDGKKRKLCGVPLAAVGTHENQAALSPLETERTRERGRARCRGSLAEVRRVCEDSISVVAAGGLLGGVWVCACLGGGGARSLGTKQKRKEE